MKLPCSFHFVCAAGRRIPSVGFTLPEVLISIVIGVIFLGVVALTGMTFSRSFAGMYNYTDLNMTSRMAMDQMSRDIRGASSVKTNTASQLQLASGNNTITYTWVSDSGKVIRDETGQPTTTLLTHCRTWTVNLYQKTPLANYSNYVATSIDETKLISIQWQCYRTVLGINLNSEVMDEAKIVLRN